MQIAVIAIGTRGDVEPFLVVAELLREHGHTVHCAFPEQYAHLATDRSFPFTPFDRRFLELVEGEAGRAFLGGRISGWPKLKALWSIFRDGQRINRRIVAEQRTLLTDHRFDRAVFHPKATFLYAWAALHPGRAVVLSPVPWAVYPAAGEPHLGFGWLGRMGLSRFSYRLANFALRQSVLMFTKDYRKQHHLTASDVERIISSTPLFYNVSPALLPPEPDWPNHVRAYGYLRHPVSTADDLDPMVSTFMGRHENFVVVTFGSMTNPDPAGNTAILLAALTICGIAAILNVAGGGLAEPATYDRNRFLFTRTLAYDLVFPRARAVIHHGGSGTTQTGLTYGCPTLLLPHIVDQFAWASLLANKRLGPPGLPINKLDLDTLTTRVRDLVTNVVYLREAQQLGRQMRAEDHRQELLQFITAAAATPPAT